METKGIDISKWQKGLKISDVKKAGYNFVIIRGAYTTNGDKRQKKIDPCFADFYKQCKEIGMPCGIYYYSCAKTTDEGIAEANYLYENVLKGKQFEYPIYIDVEDNNWQANNGKGATDAIIGFCNRLKSLGYYAGVYSNPNWFYNKLETSRLANIPKWLACWTTSKPTFKYGEYEIWQNSDNGYIGSKRVDTDIAYKDFPAIMKENGYNGYPKPAKPVEKPVEKPVKKSVDEIAKEVVQGKWGLGNERKAKLEAAGYNYSDVQKKVNELLGKTTSTKQTTTVTKPAATAPAKKSIEQVAREVIQGKWGVGMTRKSRLTAAGYNYNTIQAKVNELLKK